MFDPASIMPIQIRDDLIIHVQGIPHDLTVKEARRIANVILALSDKSPEIPQMQGTAEALNKLTIKGPSKDNG